MRGAGRRELASGREIRCPAFGEARAGSPLLEPPCSLRMSSTPKTNHGAAAEPEDAPAPAYDPRRFQNPHPDDRAGTSKGKGKAAKNSKKATSTTTTDPKGKKGSVALGICGWCEKEGAKMKCGQCKAEAYCDRACQRVSRAPGRSRRAPPPPLSRVVSPPAAPPPSSPPLPPCGSGCGTASRAACRGASVPS